MARSRRRPDHRPASPSGEEVSAGGVVVRRDPAGLLVLLIRDSYRNWGFPKGHVEPGESHETAALREVREETGLPDVRPLASLGLIDWHFRFRGRAIHKTCHFYLMETDAAATAPLLAEGITACRWEPLAAAEQLISYDNAREVLRRAAAVVEVDLG